MNRVRNFYFGMNRVLNFYFGTFDQKNHPSNPKINNGGKPHDFNFGNDLDVFVW